MRYLLVLFFNLFIVFPGLNMNVGEIIELQNDAYKIKIPVYLNKESVFTVERIDSSGVTSSLVPEMTVIYSEYDPEFHQGHIKNGNSPVAAWQIMKGKTEIDLWNVGERVTVKANKVISRSSQEVILGFDHHDLFSIVFAIKLQEESSPPLLTWELIPGKSGWYSAGFTGIQSRNPDDLDFLYQPLVWSWKRFPGIAVLTPESFSTTAASFINTEGITEGIAVNPSEIPYRFATFENSRFGIILRTRDGRAKPMILAPIPGGAESEMIAGNSYRFSCRYFLQSGDWTAGMKYLYSDVIDFKTERQNATVSLNQTLENMISLAMDDAYSGWVPELKGADYKFDVPGTVKNVSALHPLSIALTTGNMEIYRRRALPMIEYMLSREKYLYAVNDQIKQQNPSHFLKGPCAEIGELAGLHQMTGGVNGVFNRETERIFGQQRKLNLITETGGGSWQDYLARYRISNDKSYLADAVKLANIYLNATLEKYPENFTTSAGLKDSQATFVTDYTLAWYDLIELYEETGEMRYLDAAITGADQMLLWMRSNPMAPDSIITANEGGRVKGVFPGRRYTAESYDWKEFDTSTEIQEQEVPAWRTSLAGLLPEVPYTYMYGPIMLTHHAPWMLRIAHLTGDQLFKDAAYNAVIGRYANFPGYYFTSLHTTVYQQSDYPMYPYFDIKYNAIFYNHIWPHIALIQDFLVSDAFLKSEGKVSFPSAYSPGYAFLTSKVYGHTPGEVFGNEEVHLWLPKNAIHSSSIALNHLFGRTENDTYLVLINTSRENVNTELYLNQDVLKWNSGQEYPIATYAVDGDSKEGLFKEGRFIVDLPPEGLVAIKIIGLKNDVPVQRTTRNIKGTDYKDDYFRHIHQSPALGTITGMLISLVPEFSDAYIYSDATEKESKRAILKYSIGDQDWEVITDDSYPFEFSIHLTDPGKKLRMKWISEDIEGILHESEEFILTM
jgi:hypothetical protein